MEEENKHIDELIANYLTEGLDKNALDELKTWIAASAENQQYFICQREIWFSAVSREAASVYDKDKAFENFRNRVESQKEIQSTSRRGFSLSALWRYAAVVAIIIAVGCISYWQGGECERYFCRYFSRSPFRIKNKTLFAGWHIGLA